MTDKIHLDIDALDAEGMSDEAADTAIGKLIALAIELGGNPAQGAALLLAAVPAFAIKTTDPIGLLHASLHNLTTNLVEIAREMIVEVAAQLVDRAEGSAS